MLGSVRIKSSSFRGDGAINTPDVERNRVRLTRLLTLTMDASDVLRIFTASSISESRAAEIKFAVTAEALAEAVPEMHIYSLGGFWTGL